MDQRVAVAQMWQAINDIDLALNGDNDLERMRKLFDDADDHSIIQVRFTAQNLRQIGHAFDECNRIANASEYRPR